MGELNAVTLAGTLRDLRRRIRTVAYRHGEVASGLCGQCLSTDSECDTSWDPHAERQCVGAVLRAMDREIGEALLDGPLPKDASQPG